MPPLNRWLQIALILVWPLLLGSVCGINTPLRQEIQRVVIHGLRDEIVTDYLAVTPFATFSPTPIPVAAAGDSGAAGAPGGDSTNGDGGGNGQNSGGGGGASSGQTVNRATATPTPTETGTPTPSPSATASPTATATATATATPSPTATVSPTPTASATGTPSPTPLPTATPVPTRSTSGRRPPPPTDTATPLPTATFTATPAPLPVASFGGALTINEASSVITVPVFLDIPPAQPVTVNYTTGNGSAFAPNDYVPNAGALSFSPGQTANSFAVQIVDDSVDDPDTETINLTLTSAINATLGFSSTVISILDNDPLPVIDFDATLYFTCEGLTPCSTNHPVTILLDRPSGKTVGFVYGPSALLPELPLFGGPGVGLITGTATVPEDYGSVGDFKTLSPGVTGEGPTSLQLPLPIVDDTVPELPEAMVLELSSLSNLSPGFLMTTTLVITDND